ncbi:MAG: NMD3-related protein [Candidatus Woesearchaeota archaeon]
MPEKPASYFEGVLQLRGCSDEAMDWAHDEILRAGRARIAKVKEVRGGIDVYLSSQHYMQSLGRKLQQRFGGILKITSKIHTRDPMTCRDVHRLAVLFRQLSFKKGDLIKYKGEQWKILAVGNQVQLQNEKSGRKIRVPADKLA